MSPPPRPAQICNGGTQVPPIPLVSYELVVVASHGPGKDSGHVAWRGWQSVDSTLFLSVAIPVRRWRRLCVVAAAFMWLV